MPENLLRSSRIRPQGKFSLHQKAILQFKSSRGKFSNFYDDILKLFELSSSTITLPDDGPVVGASAHLDGRPLPDALAPPPRPCFIHHHCTVTSWSCLQFLTERKSTSSGNKISAPLFALSLLSPRPHSRPALPPSHLISRVGIPKREGKAAGAAGIA